MSTETGDRVSRIYGNFRGVDFRGDEINLSRSPESLNVWKDYKNTDSIRTRPGMALKESFSDTVWGIFFYQGALIVHSGTKLYKVVNDAKTELFSGVRAAVSNAFIYENVWYFKDGKHYLQYDGNEIGDVVGYIPTTSIGRKPEGGGTDHHDINMLSDYRVNTFVADGKDVDVENEDGEKTTEYRGSTDYYIDRMEIDEVVEITADYGEKDENGNPKLTVITDYTVDTKAGKITFAVAPRAPLTDGQANVSVKYKKHIDGYRDAILNCTLLQAFDNRVFFSGNEEFPNTVWHCSLNDPTYCSDQDVYREGMDTAQVRGIVAGNDALWVFRETSESNTNVFYHRPITDDEYGKVYPSSHSSITIGCVGKAINFNDDIVFFSDRGMEGISGDITTEQVAAHRSSLVDSRLLPKNEEERLSYKNMILEEWEGYLLVFVGNKVFLADSRTAFTNENHIEYEWFYWELEKAVTCAKVYGGVLYLGTEDGVYTLSDMTSNIESYWVTPKDKFKVPHKQKTTNKRGCVVEAAGDISVYAKVEDGEFELIGTYENVTDYFASRIKRKKFKDLQLKFHSNTRFSLETATLEVFIGGYIKR